MSNYRYIRPADTAKLIRAALKAAFPTVKFSVRTSTYSMGASIRVNWIDGPTQAEVDAVAKAYQGADFDGMIDMKVHKEHWLTPDGAAVIARQPGTVGSMGTIESESGLQPSFKSERVAFGADYVFCDRAHSAESMRRALAAAAAYWGFDPSPVEIVEGTNGAWIRAGGRTHVPNANEDIDTLVYRQLRQPAAVAA